MTKEKVLIRLMKVNLKGMAGVLLATVVSLGSATNVAQAQNLPKQMVGTWCFKDGFKDVSYYVRSECKHEDGGPSDRIFKLFPKESEGHESGCEFTKIKEIIKNKEYKIREKCGGEGMTWSSINIYSLSYDGKTLWIKTVWESKAR
jgi:hypothetical protein